MSCNINNITWKQRRWLNNKSLYDTVVIVFLFFLTKSTSVLRSIYHAQFGKYTKFHRNPQQTRPNIGLQTCRIFPKEMYVPPPPLTCISKVLDPIFSRIYNGFLWNFVCLLKLAEKLRSEAYFLLEWKEKKWQKSDIGWKVHWGGDIFGRLVATEEIVRTKKQPR